MVWFRGRENQRVRFAPGMILTLHLMFTFLTGTSYNFLPNIQLGLFLHFAGGADRIRDGKSEGWKENISGRFTVIKREREQGKKE